MFRGPSFIVSTLQEETTPIFKRLWYDWTQQQPGIKPTNPHGQCWVHRIVAFYDKQGLLRTYSSPGSSIRSPHPGSPRVMSFLEFGRLDMCSSDKAKKEAITQLQFHQDVLISTGPKGLFQQRQSEHIYSIEELVENLENLLALNGSVDDENASAGLTYLPIAERETRMGETRTALTKKLKSELLVGGISLMSGQLVSELFRDCSRSCFSQVVLRRSLFVCGVSLTSGQLIIDLFPDCTRSCFSQVVLRRRGGDRIFEMRCLFVAVGPNARFIVLPHWDNMS